MILGYTEKVKKYSLLLKQMERLINDDDPLITNLANISAAIKQTFEGISWAGFYIARSEKLYLGPFQGKVACTMIKFGEGVCGTAALKKTSQIVPDVHKYQGHIACDAESNSEIVVPIIVDEVTLMVLDLDSKFSSYFNETDDQQLQKLCDLMKNKLDLKKLELC